MLFQTSESLKSIALHCGEKGRVLACTVSTEEMKNISNSMLLKRDVLWKFFLFLLVFVIRWCQWDLGTTGPFKGTVNCPVFNGHRKKVCGKNHGPVKCFYCIWQMALSRATCIYFDFIQVSCWGLRALLKSLAVAT